MNEQLLQIEANIDNMNPEYYSGLIERFINDGANDAWLTPIIMKKGRPGIMLSILCRSDLLQSMTNLIFRHTTTIGLRYTEINRTIGERYFKMITYKDHIVHIKQAFYDGQLINESIEFDDIRSISESTGEPYKEIFQHIWAMLKQ